MIQDILFIIVNLLPFIFLGCIIAAAYINKESEKLNAADFEVDVLIHIKEDLFYNPDTLIVYRDIPHMYRNESILVHYYSPAGKEYKYNPDTKELKEILN